MSTKKKGKPSKRNRKRKLSTIGAADTVTIAHLAAAYGLHQTLTKAKINQNESFIIPVRKKAAITVPLLYRYNLYNEKQMPAETIYTFSALKREIKKYNVPISNHVDKLWKNKYDAAQRIKKRKLGVNDNNSLNLMIHQI